MSNHRFVASAGEPYFAFVAPDMANIDTIPGGGLLSLGARFRVDELPVQKATVDELHPLIAFVHDSTIQPSIMEVGITPNGRIKATNIFGDVYQTPISTIVDATRWYDLAVRYDYLSTTWTILIDGLIADSASGAGAAPLLPNAGYSTHIIIFNGREGLTRTKASISSAFASFQGTDENIYTWDFHEKSGGTLTPTKTRLSGSGTFEMTADGLATARFYNPVTSIPWGAPPSGSPAGAYQWGLETDFTVLPKPTTEYTMVPA